MGKWLCKEYRVSKKQNKTTTKPAVWVWENLKIWGKNC
jgi:hypothetical protein